MGIPWVRNIQCVNTHDHDVLESCLNLRWTMDRAIAEPLYVRYATSIADGLLIETRQRSENVSNEKEVTYDLGYIQGEFNVCYWTTEETSHHL
jgi:hypothetical protein